MNKNEFLNKVDKISSKSNSMKELWFTIIVGNGSNIFTNKCMASKYLYLFIDKILIAKVRYEDIKDIKLTEESDLLGDEK